VQDGSGKLQSAVDGGGRHTVGNPLRDEQGQRCVMNLVGLQLADVFIENADVGLYCLQAGQVLRLRW